MDPGGPAADCRKLTRHRGWCGEAKPGLTSALRRRRMSLEAGNSCRSLASTPAATVTAASRGSDCHGRGLTTGHDCTFLTIGPSVEVSRRLCVHNVCQDWSLTNSIKSGYSRPAIAVSLYLLIKWKRP